MSARRAQVLLMLILTLGILLVMPSSLFAANGRPVYPFNNVAARPPSDDDDLPKKGGNRPIIDDEEGEQYLLERDADFLSKRLSGDQPISIEEASGLLSDAQAQTEQMRANAAERIPLAYGGAWIPRGPNPILAIDRTLSAFVAWSGRIGALTILPNGTRILGGAQGGIWIWDQATYKWNPVTDNLGKLSIGALAYAPSNPKIVYAGTGEGALSGDSYAGNGILKSPDGGGHWYLASGRQFIGIAISALVVDPNDENHLYIAALRGRGGSRRVTQPPATKYGIFESTDGGSTWTPKKTFSDQFKGATALIMDPQNSNILYASFWSVGIFKSTDGGDTWTKMMNGLPADADYAGVSTRFALAISHPAGQGAVLYTGFDYVTTGGDYHPSRVWKSVDEAATWTQLPAGTGVDSVEDYCGGQCFYDNVVAVAPDNPNVVYALGQWNYSVESGGIYRSDDGGNTWKDIGFYTHPDFHAFAFDPRDSNMILMGNDGGVWWSDNRGGRLNPGDPVDAVNWEDLNAMVDPATGAVLARTGLQIGQFTSVDIQPTSPFRLWGGTQDNGTLRSSGITQSQTDITSGDGGEAITDPTNPNYLYGTYYGISPYRFDNGGTFFYSNFYIRNGLDLNDRSEFYIPFVMNKLNPDQLFLGTYRLYRTDNARAGDPADVLWTPISEDLTTGCTGTAPNGARGCLISAIAVSGAGGGVWVGTDDGLVHYASNGAYANKPSWKNVTKAPLPNRPVTAIWVDQSNSRVAVVAYGGFNQTTPGAHGHLFMTTNAGRSWTDLSGNLPNLPVNSVVVDPSFSDTIYAGTDTGPFVTNDKGGTWAPLGEGFPLVTVWRLTLDPARRLLAAATHGRGTFLLDDSATPTPALVIEKIYSDTPVGPGSDWTFTIKVSNLGNGDATAVAISDKLPAHTSFVSATDGGKVKKGFIHWTGLTVPAGGSISVQATVHIADNAKGKLLNKNYSVSSAEGANARGTPRPLRIAKPARAGLAPAYQFNGDNPGDDVTYPLTVRNLGFNQDTFTLSANGNTFPTTIEDATCTTPITQTDPMAPGATQDICVRVSIPNGTSGGTTSTAEIRAVSQNDSSIQATATVETQAVTAPILLVDDDTTNTNTIGYYTAALDAYGQPYDVWDISQKANLPQKYINAHSHLVWFTGNAYPDPLGAYEPELANFFDNGGHAFISGQDILDQAAGTVPFVKDYLHIDWDGSENQNDEAYVEVASVNGNPVTNGIGSVTIDPSVLGNTYMDYITPIDPATAAFTANGDNITALTVASGDYKIMFLAFAFEEYGNATQRADLMARALNWFSAAHSKAQQKTDNANVKPNTQAPKQDKKANKKTQ